jgi:hypothetical protein
MRLDTSRVTDSAAVAAAVPADDRFPLWRAHALVEKWDPEQTAWATERLGFEPKAADFDRLKIRPYDYAEAAGNLATTAGLNRITSLIIAAGGQAATNTATRLGTGDSSTAAAIGDTDLGAAAGSTHRWFQVMDATFPTQANGVLTFKSTFGTADGNYAWQEWGVDVAAPTVTSGNTVNALLLNHKIASLGTKVSGATWALTATLTIS